MEYPLNVPAPRSFAYVKRNIPRVTVEQRERALKSTHYNEFAFPAGMLTVDMLSDSGTTAMTDLQWSALMLGDESYGRNKGYYVLLDAMRDVFERGDAQKSCISASTRAASSTAARPKWSGPTPSWCPRAGARRACCSPSCRRY